MRYLDFLDGFETNTAPSADSPSVSKMMEYASTAAFVAAKGSAASEGDFFKLTGSPDVINIYKDGAWCEVPELTAVQTLTNKKLQDSTTTIVGSGDATKAARFEVDGITTGQTRVMTVPNFDGTLATLAGTETLSGKTLTAPQINGIKLALRRISATDTAVASDDVIQITSGTFTLALTAVASMGGKPLIIRNDGSGLVTLNPDGTETIDGETTYVLVQNESVVIFPDTSNWKIIAYTPVAGTWTPTLYDSVNADGQTAYECFYTKIKNMVHIAGRINVDATTGGNSTAMELSLPIASNFTSSGDAWGTVTCSEAFTRGYIGADTGDDRISLSVIPTGATEIGWFFSGMYRLR